MSPFFEIALLLILVFVAFELYTIKTELSRLPGLLRQGDDKKDSPTINVNVGTMPAQAAKEEARKEPEAVAVEALVAEEGAEAQESEPKPETPPPPPEAPKRHTVSSATPSGLTVMKCPSCQAENSSYRSECFSCGASLH